MIEHDDYQIVWVSEKFARELVPAKRQPESEAA